MVQSHFSWLHLIIQKNPPLYPNKKKKEEEEEEEEEEEKKKNEVMCNDKDHMSTP